MLFTYLRGRGGVARCWCGLASKTLGARCILALEKLLDVCTFCGLAKNIRTFLCEISVLGYIDRDKSGRG